MKSAQQVREFVRRRCLEERDRAARHKAARHHLATELRRYARVRELAFIEVLNAFDTPHKTKLKMPKVKRHYFRISTKKGD